MISPRIKARAMHEFRDKFPAFYRTGAWCLLSVLVLVAFYRTGAWCLFWDWWLLTYVAGRVVVLGVLFLGSAKGEPLIQETT